MSLDLQAFVKANILDKPMVVVVLVGFLSVIAISVDNARKIQHLKSIGSTDSAGLLSYIDAVRFVYDARKYISGGLAKTHARIIRIPGLFSWMVVIRGYELLEELKKLPDDVASMARAAENLLQSRYTFGHAIVDNPYQVPIVRHRMKRALPELTPLVHEEVGVAFEEYFSAAPVGEWASYRTGDIIPKIISRVSNRVIVGLPLCRNRDFIDITVDYTLTVMKTSTILNLVPHFMRPILGPLLPTIRTSLPSAEKHVAPIVKRREQQIELLGDEYERPNDMLMWLMEEAEGEEKTARSLAARVLLLNFAAIHTSSMTFLQSLYDIAARPQYLEPLREEISAVIREHGWTKKAMDNLVKVDSFMKESLRLGPMGATSVGRYIVQDYHFSDGTKIPMGSTVVVDLNGSHLNPTIYEDPTEFRPWRFIEMQELTGKRTDMISASPDWLMFGYGKHMCPGRFFAAVEIKMMMAYVVMNYDVKCKVEGIRPREIWIGASAMLDPNAEILFRKRVDVQV